MSADLTPDTEDVLQEEAHPAPMTPIPVVVEGPTRVVELPTPDLVADQVDLDNVTPVRLFGRDPRRKRLTLIASGGALRLATNSQQCQPGRGAIIPTGVPVTLTAYCEVWVMASSGSGCTVSYLSEQWTA